MTIYHKINFKRVSNRFLYEITSDRYRIYKRERIINAPPIVWYRLCLKRLGYSLKSHFAGIKFRTPRGTLYMPDIKRFW